MTAPNFIFTDGVEILEKVEQGGGSAEAPVINAKIKVVGLITNASLAKILGVAETEVSQFWQNNDTKDAKFPTLKSVTLKNIHQDMIVMLGDMKFNKATVNDFKFSIIDQQRASLKMTIGVLGISEEDSGHITTMMTQPCLCEVSPMQQDMLDDQEAA